ncbi:hypothetical protein ABZZ47_25300 [Streptomyces sp. NPDC006465]|uniref:hypothetical protein n=1 Tax=Streptomyces sp. NPDC006465 TaxID=3157174 RepID=UPI0033A76F09
MSATSASVRDSPSLGRRLAGMFDGLHGIDRASMEHVYGSAEEVPALRSPGAG